MTIRKSYPLLVLTMALVLLLASACSTSVGINAPGGSSGGSSSLTPLQVLQNSANAMKQLKSSHIVVQSTNTIATTGSAQTPPGPAATPGATATPASSNVTVNISGSGDEALPGQEQFHLTVNTLNQSTSLSEIVQGDQIYVQNPQGQWYVMNTSDFQGWTGNPFSGVNLDQNSLLALVQHTKITDHGDENLNGQSLRHITAVLDKDALRQLLTSNPQLQGALGTKNIDDLLTNTKAFLASIDVWIDETHFYVHRTQLKLNLVANTSSIGGEAPETVATNLNTIIDLSKFNAPVTITPPTNATPTDNPGAIFGIGKP
jgi:hypothetical protein